MRPRIFAILLLSAIVSGCGHGVGGNVVPQSNRSLGPRATLSTAQSCDSSVTSNFNGTAIAAGSTVWFSAVMKVTGIASTSATLNASNSTISFTANGTPYTVTAPNLSVKVDPGAHSATINYGSGGWSETVPYPFTGNILIDATQMPVQTALPGGIQHVTWSAHFTTTQPGVSIQWAWSAAVYKQFNTDYGALGVKPVDANNSSQYTNSDHAGTPENYKTYVTGGATGGGGSNFTGGLSGTTSASPCVTPSQVLLVSNQNGNSISAYPLDANGDVAPTYTIAGSNTGLVGVIGLSQDSAGNVFAATCENSCSYPDPQTIHEYANGSMGNVSPILTLSGPDTQLERAGPFVFDALGREYVAEEFATVQEYANGASGDASPIATINGPDTQLGYVFGATRGLNGDIYVLSNAPFPSGGCCGNLAEFTPGANGDAVPVSVLGGPNLGYPRGFAFDSQGSLYVITITDPSNNGPASIEKFAPGATGNAAPVTTISGADTGLNDGPGFGGLVLDESGGRIYVANCATNVISVFPINSSGDTAPQATISGPSTGLACPASMLIH